jgi:hypothetical protein
MPAVLLLLETGRFELKMTMKMKNSRIGLNQPPGETVKHLTRSLP